jgi:hypothetical protein
VRKLLNGIEKRAEKQSQLVVNVQGDYFANSNVSLRSSIVTDRHRSDKQGDNMHYKPQNWEKVIVYLTGFLFLGLVSFLVIRNQPIADRNFVVMLRVVLSMVVAVFGAVVPGMLRVDFSAKGLTIRAIGALALFVITFILTPTVL